MKYKFGYQYNILNWFCHQSIKTYNDIRTPAVFLLVLAVLWFLLTSLSRGTDQENWAVVDESNPGSRKKFYLNVCTPLKEIPVGSGCSPFAAVCQTSYQNSQVSYSYRNVCLHYLNKIILKIAILSFGTLCYNNIHFIDIFLTDN